MSTSQHSQLPPVPGTGQHEQPEQSGNGFEPTIGLKAVAKILDCSAEQCRRLAGAKKIPVFRFCRRMAKRPNRLPRIRILSIHPLLHSARIM